MKTGKWQMQLHFDFLPNALGQGSPRTVVPIVETNYGNVLQNFLMLQL